MIRVAENFDVTDRAVASVEDDHPGARDGGRFRRESIEYPLSREADAMRKRADGLKDFADESGAIESADRIVASPKILRSDEFGGIPDG